MGFFIFIFLFIALLIIFEVIYHCINLNLKNKRIKQHIEYLKEGKVRRSKNGRFYFSRRKRKSKTNR